jgi:hypothetical protein
MRRTRKPNKGSVLDCLANIYTPVRQKKWPEGVHTRTYRLSPDQAKRKVSLVSRFITDRWGSASPGISEKIDQRQVEAYEGFIDPYVLADLPIPEYQEKQPQRLLIEQPSDSTAKRTQLNDRPNSSKTLSETIDFIGYFIPILRPFWRLYD